MSAALAFAVRYWHWIVLLLVYLMTLGASYRLGEKHERAAWESRQAAAIAKARTTENAGASIANTAERDALVRANQQREQADAELTQLRAELARNQTLLDRCRVPRAVVRVLDGGPARVPAVTGPAPRAGPAAEGVAGDAGVVTGGGGTPPAAMPDPPSQAAEGIAVADVMENAAWNRLHVCEANAAQVRELQAFYESVKQRFNAP